MAAHAPPLAAASSSSFGASRPAVMSSGSFAHNGAASLSSGSRAGNSQGGSSGGFAYLTAKVRTGSCKLKLAYSPSERAIHSSEMPAPARRAREELALAAEADKRRWRSETNTFRVPERRSLQNFVKDPTEYAFNFRAEVLPAPRPVVIDSFGRVTQLLLNREEGHFHRLAEAPVHPELQGKARWDSATQLPAAERAKRQASETALHRAASAGATRRLLASRGFYESPEARERRRMEELRAERRAAADAATDPAMLEEARAASLRWTANTRDTVTRTERYRPASPRLTDAASLAAAAAAATAAEVRAATPGSPRSQSPGGGGGPDRNKGKGSAALEAYYASTLATEAALRSRAVSVPARRGRQADFVEAQRFHSGVYETLPAGLALAHAAAEAFAAPGSRSGSPQSDAKPHKRVSAAWSCCGAEAKDSAGCCVTKQSKHRWELTGI